MVQTLYTCLFNDGQDRSLTSNSGSKLQVVHAYLSMHIYLTEMANTPIDFKLDETLKIRF